MENNYINWIVKPSKRRIEIKEKDRKLIEVLASNSRASLKEIGKRLRLSNVAVFNRIKNLEKQGIIIGYSCLINFNKLGFSTYHIGLRVNMTIEQKEHFLEKIQKYGFINQILKLSGGRWDFLIRIISKEDLLNDQIDKILIATDQISKLEVLHVFRTIFIKLPKKEKILTLKEQESINSFETKLLYELAKNSRQKIIDLSVKLNSTTKRIISSIKRLKKRGIILGFFPEINPLIYGNEGYLLIISTKNRKIQEEIASNLILINSSGAFIHFQNPNIVSYHIVPSLNDLKEIETSLEKYKDYIKNYSFIRIESQIQYNLFPKQIYNLLMGK